MNLSEIKNELQQVLQLVEDWHEKGVNDLERDLALGKLRKIYSNLRFESTPQPESIDAEEQVAPASAVAATNEPESLNVDFSEGLPVGIAISLDDVLGSLVTEDLIPEVAPFAEQEPLFEPEAEAEPIIEEPEQPAEMIAEVAEEEVEEFIPAEPELPAIAEVEPVEEPIAEVIAEVEPELPTEEGPTVDVVTEVEPQPTPEPAAATIAEPSLFGDELFAPRPSRRTRMMSLYDDEPSVAVVKPKAKVTAPAAPPVVEEQPAPSPIVEPAPAVAPAAYVEPIVASEPEVEDEFVEVNVESVPVQEPTPEVVAEPLMPEVDEPATVVAPAEPKRVELPAQDKPSKPAIEQAAYIEPQVEVAVTKSATSVVPESEQVLGEVLKSDVRTIADIIAPKNTTVEQIAKGAISDINKAVGVNDRYLLIRDLFGGSAEEYERVVATLNDFDNLEDCMIYIDEHFDWNPNSDGAKMLMELLERKYC